MRKRLWGLSCRECFRREGRKCYDINIVQNSHAEDSTHHRFFWTRPYSSNKSTPTKSGSKKSDSSPDPAKKKVVHRSQALRVSGESHSSTLWLQRQLKDPYVKKAASEGYMSRAAFKLQQMDDKYGFIKPGKCVIDLGAAPGGWSQVISERLFPIEAKTQQQGNNQKEGLLVGIDTKPLKMALRGDVVLLEADATAPDTLSKVKDILQLRERKLADLVLSDMAPTTIGNKYTDHQRLMILNEEALAFAQQILERGGIFITKVSRGGEEKKFLDKLKDHFDQVTIVKPDASRTDSAETYFYAKGFKAGVHRQVQKE